MDKTDGDPQAAILILDNTDIDCKLLCAGFKGDYYIKQAGNSIEALQMMCDGTIAAVLCDLDAPQYRDFLQQLRSDNQLPQVPVFALVAEDDDEGQLRALDMGVIGILTKPVKPQILCAQVKNVLENHWYRMDSLTGLYNNENFYHEAFGKITEWPEETYLLVCFDVDNFKAINAQYGRIMGDQVLKQIGKIAKAFADRHQGIACRMSADNFAMLLFNNDSLDLTELVTSVREEFNAQRIHIKLQFSIGSYIINDKRLLFNDMISNALLAKGTIKGRYNVSVATYNQEMKEQFMEEQRIISRMDYALAEGQFEVWLQPQYNHENGVMTGAEALARWRDTERNILIPPNVFIPIFERNGFIYELDKYIWEQVCIFLRRWLDKGREPLPVSVNISRIDLLQNDFLEKITGLTKKYSIPTDLLQLEITESAFSFDTERIIEMVKKLRSDGFVVEIDDFGSGYSSFNVLKDVPADVLKLDMRFLSGEDRTGRGGNIIESIVRMAKWLGMRVIAEGVETKEQADFLQSIGCLLVQGYLYNRPMQVEAFEKLSQCREKNQDEGMFEMINTLDNNAFWSPESIESLIFNSYVGGACVAEFKEGTCEIIRANEKYREELRTEIPLADILRTNLFTFMSEDDSQRIQDELLHAEKSGGELKGEVAFHIHNVRGRDEEWLRYYGRVIAKSQTCHVVYFLFENITEQKLAEKKVAETTKQLQTLNEISKSILSKSDTKDAIESLLQRQMAYFDANQAYVIEFDEENQVGTISYQISTEYLKIPAEVGTQFSYTQMPCWINQLHNNRHIVIKSVNALDDQWSVDKKLLLGRGISSLISIPLMRNGILIGMLGVIQPRRAFSHVEYLAALGDYVVILLERRDLLNKIEGDNVSMQQLMNDTPGGFARMKVFSDGSGVPVFVNDTFCEIMGMTRDEMLKMYSQDAYAGIHPDDRSTLKETVIKALREESVFSARIRFFNKIKGYLYYQAFYRVTKDSSGNPYINGYYAEMTKEVELEERRKELLDNLPCGAAIFEIKNDRLIAKHVNQSYMKQVGRSETEIHADNAITAIYPEDRERLLQALHDAIMKQTDMTCDFRVLCGDGSYLPMHVVGKLEQSEEGSMSAYVTYIPISEETMSVNVALEHWRNAEKLAQEVNEQLLFLNDISRYLLIAEDPDAAIQRSLQKVMEHFDSERAYLFELDDERAVSVNTYEICAPGIASQKENLQALPYESQNYALEEFRSGKKIYIEDIDKMPEYRAHEKQVFVQQGISNVFLVPLRSEGGLIGYAGVDNPKKNTRHSDQLVAIGDYLASMLIRRNHVQRMKDDNKLLQRLMNDTPGGFVRTRIYPDGLTVPLFVNDGFCQMTGMSREEVMELYSKDSLEGVHPDDIPELLHTIDRALKEDFIVSTRIRFLHKKKGYIHLQVFYRIVTDVDGTKYSNGYYADMTEITLLEERRKELLDNLPCGAVIFEVTADGILKATHVNKRYAELVNRSSDELHMQDAIQTFYPEDRSRIMDTINEAIKLGRETECDVRVIKNGGGYIAFHLVLRTISKENQNTVVYVTYMPITEEKRSLSVALADQHKAEKLAQDANEQLRFLNDSSRYLLMGDNPEDAILQTLYKTMEYFDGDRAYIFELDDEQQMSHNTYECCAPGIVPEQDNLQNVPYSLQEYALHTFYNKESICLENISDIYQSGIDANHVITNQGIHSLILVPIWMGKKLIGFMGVDNPDRNISHVDHLIALSDYMASMILRRNSEAQILADNRIMRDMMNDMPGGFVQMKLYPDGRAEPVFMNKEFCHMSGMSYEQCLSFYGNDAYIGVHPDDQEMVRSEMEDLIANRDTRTLRIRLANGSGDYVLMQVFYRVTEDSAGNLYLNGYYTDMTEQITQEERKLAEHDELTGLFNRTKLVHMRSGEYKILTSCGVLFFDVNHLKIVNDTQGHDKGDALLRLVADGIHSITGQRIHGYRYGGDEFLVIVCNGSEDELPKLVELWCSRMNLLAKDRKIMATAAVGMAWSEAPFSLDDLIQKADQEMYIDKQKNKQYSE